MRSVRSSSSFCGGGATSLHGKEKVVAKVLGGLFLVAKVAGNRIFFVVVETVKVLPLERNKVEFLPILQNRHLIYYYYPLII